MISSDIDAGQCHNEMLGQAEDAQLRISTLPLNMVAMLRADAWRRLVRPKDQRVFINTTVAQWVLGEPWPGLGFPDWATLYALLVKNITVGPECLARLQALGAPTVQDAERLFETKRAEKKGDYPTPDSRGAKGGRGHKASDNVTSFRGNRAEYLARRLHRDAPDIFQALERGEYKSVYAAAKAAGLVTRTLTVPDDVTRAVAKLVAHYGLDAVRKALEEIPTP